MNRKYTIIFEGKVSPGFDVEEVKRQISQLLKIPEHRQEDFFSGQRINLKTNITLNDASCLKRQLENHGLITSIISSEFFDLSIQSENLSIADINRVKILEPNYEKEKREDPTIRERRVEYRKAYNEHVMTQKIVEPDPSQAPSPFALFDFKGRYGRVSYINAHLIWLGIFSCIAYFLIGFDFSTITTVFDDVGKSGPLALSYVLYSLLMIRQTILRLHDLDMKGYFCVLQFIPVIGWFVIFFLIFAKGTPESNEYGAAPEQGSTDLICILVGLYFFFAIYSNGVIFKP